MDVHSLTIFVLNVLTYRGLEGVVPTVTSVMLIRDFYYGQLLLEVHVTQSAISQALFQLYDNGELVTGFNFN